MLQICLWLLELIVLCSMAILELHIKGTAIPTLWVFIISLLMDTNICVSALQDSATKMICLDTFTHIFTHIFNCIC